MDYSLVLCVVQIILLFLVLFPLATHKCSIIKRKCFLHLTLIALLTWVFCI